MVLLAAVCSAGAFCVMAALVAEVGPVRATTVTYLNPAVALVAGAVVLGEPISGWAVVGFALILSGCFLAAVRRPVRSRGTAPGRPGRAQQQAGAPLADAAAAAGPVPAEC
jgi:drug/metabolite transporter (DMT)-like permease